VSEADVSLFAEVTGDINPVHLDEEYANGTLFQGRICHGMLSAGLVSAALANKLPGIGTIYLGQNLQFTAPVRIGETVRAEVEVVDLNVQKNIAKLRTTCTTQNGTVVIKGEATVVPPKKPKT
jgi:3-hydroxybutyryl-CoA dehydratase